MQQNERHWGLSFSGVGEGTGLKLLKSFDLRGWLLAGTAACCLVLSGAIATFGSSAQAGGPLDERKQTGALEERKQPSALEKRKQPMKFNWIACEPNCQGDHQGDQGWISAVGVITADTPKDFDDFARGRKLGGATVVLDSSGGSVNDAITLGRRFRSLGLLTTVGVSVRNGQDARPSVAPEAYCESMCVFLLLSGKKRYVPGAAHVRVHQIWMGDRADDAEAASYTAQDLMIVERDIGRLAKYTFDMGGAGDLLSLALNVPPWENLHELDASELKLTNLVTTDLLADVLPDGSSGAMTGLSQKALDGVGQEPDMSTRTAEAMAPTGGATTPGAGLLK